MPLVLALSALITKVPLPARAQKTSECRMYQSLKIDVQCTSVHPSSTSIYL